MLTFFPSLKCVLTSEPVGNSRVSNSHGLRPAKHVTLCVVRWLGDFVRKKIGIVYFWDQWFRWHCPDSLKCPLFMQPFSVDNPTSTRLIPLSRNAFFRMGFCFGLLVLLVVALIVSGNIKTHVPLVSRGAVVKMKGLTPILREIKGCENAHPP